MVRALIQVAYAARRKLLSSFRIRTRGVKVMLFNDAGELLLIRNGYGDSGLFLLPGGGISPRESPADAASREVREELQLNIWDVHPVAIYASSAEGKRDTIHLFRATAAGQPLVDNREVVDARFFALDALPENVSPATRRRIQEWKGERPIDGRW